MHDGGDRPAIVAYDRSFGSAAHPTGLQRSVYMQVLTDGAAGPVVGLNTTLDVFPNRAVGVQYGDANPSSVGTNGGRNNSWLWVEGTRSLAEPHFARAVDLPQSSFGYLLVSATPGDVNLAGGSQGRLCLSGSIGRYVSAIANSFTTGRISTTIDPSALPQPTGNVVALPGQTWHFQLWHRDSVGGFSTRTPRTCAQ